MRAHEHPTILPQSCHRYSASPGEPGVSYGPRLPNAAAEQLPDRIREHRGLLHLRWAAHDPDSNHTCELDLFVHRLGQFDENEANMQVKAIANREVINGLDQFGGPSALPTSHTALLGR
jgi:hypothetical protein